MAKRPRQLRTIWQWSGRYALDAVGETFNYEALSSFEWPASFESAVLLCAAELVHQPDNPHDANAIAIGVEGRHVGFLSREDAVAYHHRIGALRVSSTTTWANCLICGSNLHTDEQRFSVQLDLDLESGVQIDNGLAHEPSVILPNLTPVFVKKDGYGFAVANWLPLSAVITCRPGDRLKVWRKPDSDELFLFAPGTIGSMGRVLMVTDELLSDFGFTELADFKPIVYSVGLRELTICFKTPSPID